MEASHQRVVQARQEDKESFGYSRSPMMTQQEAPLKLSSPVIAAHRELLGYEDRKKEVNPDTYTGRRWLRSARRSLLPVLKECSEERVMPSCPDRQPQMNTSQRNLQELKNRLNWEVLSNKHNF